VGGWRGRRRRGVALVSLNLPPTLTLPLKGGGNKARPCLAVLDLPYEDRNITALTSSAATVAPITGPSTGIHA
jgi:hypothetical protein